MASLRHAELRDNAIAFEAHEPRTRAAIAGWVVALVLGCLTGCGPSTTSAFVELVTDLRVPQDFVGAAVYMTPVGHSAPLDSAERSALEFAGDPLEGVRVHDFNDLPSGVYTARIELRDPLGATVAVRERPVQLGEARVIPFTITRQCLHVMCPETPTSSATVCVNGRCVEPECDPDIDEDQCEDDAACSDANPCPGSPVECVDRTCVGGFCLDRPDDAQCADDRVCDAVAGCVSGCAEVGCDDGNACTDDVCGPSGCSYVANAATCDDGVFCNGADSCSGGACSPGSANPCSGTTTCSEAMDTCVGCVDDGDCPDDIVVAASCVAEGVCDESGIQARETTAYTCDPVTSTCESSTSVTHESCALDPTGETCGPSGATCADGACMCPGGPGPETVCGDGSDNDCDGDVDCDDADCDGLACGADGAVCLDSGCACPGGSTETQCGDGIDNDCDGATDCADEDCGGRTCDGFGQVCEGMSCGCTVHDSLSADGAVADIPPAVVFVEGRFLIFYGRNGASGVDLYVARVPEGTALVEATIRLTSTESVLGSIDAAVGPSGVIAVWEDGRHPTSSVFAARTDSGGAPIGGPMPAIPVSIEGSHQPAIAPDESGGFGLVFISSSGVNSMPMFVPLSSTGMAMDAASPIDGVVANSSDIDIARAEGAFIAAWEIEPPDQVMIANIDASGSDPDGIQPLGVFATRAVALTPTTAGSVAAVYEFGALPDLALTEIAPTGSVGAPVDVTGGSAVSETRPAIAEQSGRMMVAWTDRGPRTEVVSRRGSLGGFTAIPLTLSCGDFSARHAAVEIGDTQVGIAWIQDTASGTVLRFTRLRF